MQAKNIQNVIFFENLRYLVNKSGLRDCQVADALGIHKVSFSRYFRERRIPKRSVLSKICALYKVSLQTMLTERLSERQQEDECACLNEPPPPLPSSFPPIDEIASDTDFTLYFRKRTQELQDYINNYVNDILKKYNQSKNR